MATRYQENQKTILCIMYNFMHNDTTVKEFTDELMTSFQAAKINFSSISRTIMKEIVLEVVTDNFQWKDEYYETFYENDQYYLVKPPGWYFIPEREHYSDETYGFRYEWTIHEFRFKELTTAMDLIELLDKLAAVHTDKGQYIYGLSMPFYFKSRKMLTILYDTVNKFINKYPDIVSEKIKTEFYKI